MRSLYLLLAVLVTAPAAMAQWTYAPDFLANNTPITGSNHGLAVDPNGKIWIQSNTPTTRDSVAVDPAVVANSTTGNCNKTTNRCRVTAIYVLNPDGTNVSFSPLSIVTLPGGVRDTLGGEVIRSGTGVRSWTFNTGRGLARGPSGDVYAVIGAPSSLYRFDYRTGAVADFTKLPELEIRGASGPFLDRNGNVYVTGVFQDPIAIYNSNLDYVGNVVNKDRGINRTVLALPDGNTVIALNYSNKVSTIYRRADEFATSYDSTGATFEGMAVESATIHPITGNVWASSGSPNDPPTGRYQTQRWYEFTVADMLSNRKPTPRDSIVLVDPGTGTTGGRPRAIAFSNDGNTAYVGMFNFNVQGRASVQKFTKGTVATEGTIQNLAALGQNQPNPFSGSTDIAYSLEQPAYTRLRVLDLTGREVAVLVDGQMGVGQHRATFRPEGLASGVYVYMLEVDGQATTRRMLHIVR